MIKILSIDFDYFIDAPVSQREELFPYGSDEVPHELLSTLWERCYKKYPEIKEIGVIDEFDYLIDYLDMNGVQREHVLIADSHKDIKNIIDEIPNNEIINIVNIDFHHDYYHYYRGKNTYNCGNWLRRLIEERPDSVVKWVRREDSQMKTLDGEFPFESTTEISIINSDEFDYIFLCKSPEWTPPHLGSKFNDLVEVLRGGVLEYY